MTVGEWLESRVSPPDALAARIRSAVGVRWSALVGDATAVCEAAAEELLGALLARDDTGREAALDLLVADALTTYAFEYAAEAGAAFDAEARAAMERIAAAGARLSDATVA